MGIVPNLCTGVWVGAEDRATHFETTTYGQGAAMALPIWALYMRKCYKDETLKVSKGAFERPANLSIQINCDEYKATAVQSNDTQEEDEELDF